MDRRIYGFLIFITLLLVGDLSYTSFPVYLMYSAPWFGSQSIESSESMEPAGLIRRRAGERSVCRGPWRNLGDSPLKKGDTTFWLVGELLLSPGEMDLDPAWIGESDYYFRLMLSRLNVFINNSFFYFCLFLSISSIKFACYEVLSSLYLIMEVLVVRMLVVTWGTRATFRESLLLNGKDAVLGTCLYVSIDSSGVSSSTVC